MQLFISDQRCRVVKTSNGQINERTGLSLFFESASVTRFATALHTDKHECLALQILLLRCQQTAHAEHAAFIRIDPLCLVLRLQSLWRRKKLWILREWWRKDFMKNLSWIHGTNGCQKAVQRNDFSFVAIL